MMHTISTTCCITGGGPAGVMLGLLLARSGIDVIVLEKHSDFLRDFRGDTVHPSTMQIINELGLLDDFLKEPHQKIAKFSINVDGEMVTLGDLSNLNCKTPYIAMMPQWDFLNFLVAHAKKLPNFKIMMQSELVDIILEDNIVTGAIVKQNQDNLIIKSYLLIGADGRHSTVRKKANLTVYNYGIAIDALWFRLSRLDTDPIDTFANVTQGQMLVMINRHNYWQCAYIIPKGQMEHLKKTGLNSFLTKISNIRSILKQRVHEITSWDQIKLLEVQVNRLKQWYAPGVLCIGDAAHAMSPVGGVGINLAIQDAVATSNILTNHLINRTLNITHLQTVQKRRELPTKLIQKMQITMHKNIIYKAIDNTRPFQLPWLFKIASRFSIISKILGYIIGMGIRPEHIKNHN